MVNGELPWGSWRNLEKRGRIKKTSQLPGIKAVGQNFDYLFKEDPAKTRVKL